MLATCKGGLTLLNALLDDYAFLIAALLELLQAEFSGADLEFAEHLAEVLLEQFEDREAGGFFFTSRDHERLLHRPKPGHDNAMPSGNGVAAFALNRLAALTGEDRFARAAERAVGLFYPSLRDRPAGFGMLAIALEEQLTPPAVAVLRGAPAALSGWSAELAREFLPGAMVVAIPDGAKDLPPLLDKPAPRPAGSGAVNAWLCRGVTCLPPIADLGALKQACKQAGIR